MKKKLLPVFGILLVVAAVALVASRMPGNTSLQGYLPFRPGLTQNGSKLLPSAQDLPHNLQPENSRLSLTYDNSKTYGSHGLTASPQGLGISGGNFGQPSLDTPNSTPNPFSPQPTPPSTQPTPPSTQPTPPSTQPTPPTPPTPPSTSTGTSTSTSSSLYKGICLVRTQTTSIPLFTAPDFGNGYAKKTKGSAFTSYTQIDDACAQTDYAALTQLFCLKNPKALYQMQVGLYRQDLSLYGVAPSKYGTTMMQCS